MESMSERLKRLRTEHKMTQEDVGKVIGVQKAAINKYECGNVENIKRTSILKLAKLYGVSPSYILCFEEDKKELSPKEHKLLSAYKSKPEMQPAVDRLLGIDETEINKPNNIETYIPKTNEPAIPPRRIAAAGAAGTKQITPPPPRRVT